MRCRPGRRAAMIVGGVGMASLLLGLPAMVDLDLVGGDAAEVMYTDGDGVNVRSAPDASAGILTTLPEDAPVTIADAPVLSDDGSSWYAVEVETTEGFFSGWIISDYLGHVAADDWETAADSIIPEAPDDSDSEAQGVPITITIGGEDVNLRESPDRSAYVLTSIPDGASIEVLEPVTTDESGNTRSLVRYDGVVGYSTTEFLGPANVVPSDAGASTAIGDAIVAESLSYLGVPYLWGGTTPEGFDCSGFTYVVVNRALESAYPRPMEEKIEVGTWVAARDLIPGDFVYFQNTYQWGVSHIGIYLGEGQFVSASGEHDSVGISSFYAPYWQARYLTARRVG